MDTGSKINETWYAASESIVPKSNRSVKYNTPLPNTRPPSPAKDRSGSPLPTSGTPSHLDKLQKFEMHARAAEREKARLAQDFESLSPSTSATNLFSTLHQASKRFSGVEDSKASQQSGLDNKNEKELQDSSTRHRKETRSREDKLRDTLRVSLSNVERLEEEIADMRKMLEDTL